MAFAWQRGRAGASVGSSADTLLNVKLITTTPSANWVVRRIIIRWSLDYIADDRDGGINSICPTTLGVMDVGSATSSPTPPASGPKSDPGAAWKWWDGVVFDNYYGVSTVDISTGYFQAKGKIDRDAPYEMNMADAYHTFYLSFEIEDVDSSWNSFAAIAWYQILTAPLVG